MTAIEELAAVRYRGWVLGWEDMTTEDAREAARLADRLAHAGFLFTAIDVVDLVVQLRSGHRSDWSPTGDGRDADPTSTTEVPPMIYEHPSAPFDPRVIPLDATTLEAAQAEAQLRQGLLDAARAQKLAGVKDELDRKSRGEPVIVSGTPEQMASLEREMRVGRQELARRRRRRDIQRESRRRNRPES